MRTPVLAIAILLAGCTGRVQRTERVGVDPALASFIPSGTILLLDTRIDELRKTPVYQKYFQPRRFATIQEFAAKTGIDPSADLFNLLYAANGKDGIALGRGNFSAQARQRLKASEGVILLSDNVAAIGPPAMLKSLNKRGGVPSGLDPLLEQIEPGSQFWAAFKGQLPRLPVDERSNLDNLNRLLASVRSGFFYANFQPAGLKSEASAICATEKDAQELLSSLQSIVSLAKMSTKSSEKDLLALYDSIRISKDQHNRVSMELSVPESELEKFLDLWMGRVK